MLLKIRHALLEISSYPSTKKSAIIINNEVIITSGSILQPFVRPIVVHGEDNNSNNNSNAYADDDNVCASTKIIRKLQQCQAVNLQDSETDEARHLNCLNYHVTFDRKKLPVTIQNSNGIAGGFFGGINGNNNNSSRQPNILTKYNAKPLYLFSTAEISRQMHKLLYPYAGEEHNDCSEVLISSFLVLSMSPSKERERFERFLQHIGHYLRYLHTLHTLDDVMVMCTPFGLENFYKTISIGKIANVLGRDGCVFGISCALPLGCEGSAVFNSRLRLIGVVLCTSFQRNNENINMVLVANFAHLLKDFMRQLNVQITSITLPRRTPSSFAWERTMVVIEADGTQGSGTFVKVHNKKFILTCTHVVYKVNTKAVCRSVDGEFESDVLWRNPQYNRAFDVALLAAPDNIPDRYCVRLSNLKPSTGQTVYNAGFPYFVNFNLKYDFNPSIFQGRIIKCYPGAIMSDGCVQAGQSGGPMFDPQGCLLGICVSNMKLDEIVYPNINTAVPICEIRLTLENYAKTNDVNVLSNLVATNEMQRIWSLETPTIQSKL